MPTQAGGWGGADRMAMPRFTRRRTRQRRNEAIAALDTHAGLVLQSAARILGSVADAEDVAQDVAEKLLRSPPGDIRSWPALLKTMAVNRAIDVLRRRREEDSDHEPVSHDGPEQAATRHEKAQTLRRALARLSERDALLFGLYYLGDLTQADIGRQLDMTATAVGVALHRLRQRLAATIDPSQKPDPSGGS